MTTQSTNAASDYVLGHSDRELARLERQAGFFAEATRDVLERAGIGPGMRVLDIGCGVGDVSAIAADLVGPEGRVLGIDHSAEALAVARRRMAASGREERTAFETATIEAYDDYAGFDAVIGRFILLHVPDPAALVAGIARRLEPGTRLAFLEMDLGTATSLPEMPLLKANVERIAEVYRRTGKQMDMGAHLFAVLRAAGLDPQAIGTTRIGNARDEAGFEFLAESVRSLMPAMQALGVAEPETVGIDTLRERLAAEAAAHDPCIFYPRLIGAWAQA